MSYPNVNPMIGAVLSAKMATLAELSTVLSTEDVYTMCEILAVDNYNSRPRK